MTVREILATHPKPNSLDREAVVRCIEECLNCTATCTSCADACLAEEDVKEQLRCIRLCLDCADVCTTTARVVIRQTETDLGVVRATVEACASACRASGAECERHAAHHEHCRICTGACRDCEQACESLLATMA